MAQQLRDLGKRARQAVIWLWIFIGVFLALIVSDIVALPLIDDVYDVNALDDFVVVTGIASLVEVVAAIVTAVFFIRWFNLAHRSLDGLCSGVRRHATWWSIGGWFIPIWWFFRPSRSSNDMLRCHDDDLLQPWWAPAWWVMWLISSIGGNVVTQLLLEADTSDELRTATIIDAVTNAVFVVSAVLAIIVVRSVTAELDDKRRSLQSRLDATPLTGPG